MSYRNWKRAYQRGKSLKLDREAMEQTRKEREAAQKAKPEEKPK